MLLGVCHILAVSVLVTQSHPTLCDPMDCSPPDSSVHGIFQATLERVAISYSRYVLWNVSDFGSKGNFILFKNKNTTKESF